MRLGAEVEVDVETGEVRLKQFTTAHSTGTVINPLMHQGQIDGGVGYVDLVAPQQSDFRYFPDAARF